MSTRSTLSIAVALCVLGSASSLTMWAQNTQNRKTTMKSSASLPIGKYRLDMSSDGLTGLTEFSETEYSIYGRNFVGEKNFHAPSVELVNRNWKVDLGTVNGKIYKIAFYFESENKSTVIDASTDLMQYCQQRLGKPTEQQETIFTWDTADGNVVMQLGKVGTTYMINLFETSRAIRSFLLKR